MIDIARLLALREYISISGKLVARDASEALDTIEALWKENAGLLEEHCSDCDEECVQSYEKGFSEAQEKAAKVVGNYSSNDGLLHEAFKVIAERICALKSDEGQQGNNLDVI